MAPVEFARAARAAFLMGGEQAAEEYMVSVLCHAPDTAFPCPGCEGGHSSTSLVSSGCEMCGGKRKVLVRHTRAHLDYLQTLAAARVVLTPKPTIQDALAVQQLTDESATDADLLDWLNKTTR